MGTICSCFRDEYEEFGSPFCRNCICLRCLTQNFLHLYTSLFRRGEVHALSPSTQGSASLSSAPSLDDSIADMYRSPPRPSRYDAETRHFRSQHDGLVSRREKGSSHSYEEAEPLRRSGSDVDNEFVGSNWTESACEHGSKEYDSKISLKLSTAKASTPYLFPYMYTSFEEEEVCPTCLEEYTEENPKISKIQRSSQNALIISILVAYMSGWREVKVVLFVARRISWQAEELRDLGGPDPSPDLGENLESEDFRTCSGDATSRRGFRMQLF